MVQRFNTFSQYVAFHMTSCTRSFFHY
uniref:Uncharacterized protein n=1 Tax=Lepeophtheirus salmonis TaxID=72036 RepID=A0A0K2T472_LEPSM